MTNFSNRSSGNWVPSSSSEGGFLVTGLSSIVLSESGLITGLPPAGAPPPWLASLIRRVASCGSNAAPFPSAVVVFRGPPVKGMAKPPLRISTMENKNV